MLNGKLHRWARDSSEHGTAGGSRLHLFRVETLSKEDYWESYRMSIEPSGRGVGGSGHEGVMGVGSSGGIGPGGGEADGDGGWAAGRLHHVDIQPVLTEPRGSSGDAPASVAPNSSWLGLIDGDEFADGGLAHHFLGPDGGWRLVRAKRVLLQLVLAQVGDRRGEGEGQAVAEAADARPGGWGPSG